MTDIELYKQHLAEMDPGHPAHEALEHMMAGKASAADLITYARWELRECMDSLPPDPHDEPRGRPVDGFHAGCCAMRAESALHRLERLLGLGHRVG